VRKRLVMGAYVKTYMLVELVIGRKEGRISERELASLGPVGSFNDEHDIVEGGRNDSGTAVKSGVLYDTRDFL
jgi:hypothetical protein